MEKAIRTRVGEGRYSWRTLFGQRRAWSRIHCARFMEEETDLETCMEKSVEDRQEAGVDTPKEDGMEGRMGQSMEDREKTNLEN